MEAPKDPYICEKCLKVKDARKEGFGLIWRENNKDVFMCKDCAEPILKKAKPNS